MNATTCIDCRQPIERFASIATLLRNGTAFDCTQVAQRFEVSPRTILRDINFMRDRLQFEIEWDAVARTWRLLRAPRPVLL